MSRTGQQGLRSDRVTPARLLPKTVEATLRWLYGRGILKS
jgi:hypothetical protein